MFDLSKQLVTALNREWQAGVSLIEVNALIDSQPAEACEMLLELIEQAGEHADAAFLGDLYCKLGNCRVVLYDPGAIKDFESALEYAEKCQDLVLKTGIFHGLARAFITFGDTHSALQYCEKALELGRKLHDPHLFAQILMTLGLAFAVTQQFERCVMIYAEAAELCRTHSDTMGLARVLNNWADALTSSYEHAKENRQIDDVQILDEAIFFGRQALALAEECGSFRYQLLAIETLAHAMEDRGLYAVALDELEVGMSKLAGHGFIKEELDIQVRLGALELCLKRADPAIVRLSRARDLALKIGNYPHLSDILKTLSIAYEAAGDITSALATYKEFHQVTLKSHDQRAQISAQIFAAKLDLEKVQKESESHKSRANQLENHNRNLNVEVREDSLTGLANRRALQEHLLHNQASAAGGLTFALLDIDHFKQVNDTFSHLTGDEVLRQFGQLIRTCLRAGDLAARIGGEEFALVLDHTSGARSLEACERIRSAIELYNWSSIAPGLHITASFGVSDVRQDDDLLSMMSRADTALYQAKKAGRNRIAAL